MKNRTDKKSINLLLLLLILPLVLIAQLPKQVDLSPYCPTPGNQGTAQSCTGWAIGYGAMTIEKAKQVDQRNRQVINRNAYSATFLYQQLHGGDCQRGVSISSVLLLAKNRGNCLAGQFDRLTKDCRTVPGKGLKQKALTNRLKHYQLLFSNNHNALQKIEATRRSLAKGKPVIVSMKVKNNFYKVRKGAKYYWPTQGDQSIAGGHAMVIVGYDDQKRAFRLLNSLGTNWGDNGFIWIKYQAFHELCRSAYVIYLNSNR